MKTLKAYKYRLKPNADQIMQINQHFGSVRFVRHRELPEGKIKTCTISRNATGKFFIGILLEKEVNDIIPCVITEQETVAGDLGLKSFLTLSDGTVIPNPRFLQTSLTKLRKAQRLLSRMKKGSKRRAKQKLVVAKLHEQVANARKDFHHQVTNQIAVKNHATTYIGEDLAVSNMIKNPKLSRHIADVGWGMFDIFLAYKMKENGKNYIKIDRFAPSSKTCTHCGHLHQELKLSDRVFTCPSCGQSEDRDLAASINIKRFGLQQISEQAGIVCGVKCSSRTKLPRSSVRARGATSSLHRSPVAHARVGTPTWRE